MCSRHSALDINAVLECSNKKTAGRFSSYGGAKPRYGDDNYNVAEKDLQRETVITTEHAPNSSSVRPMLGERGIKPEELPLAEGIKKLERRVTSQAKKIAE